MSWQGQISTMVRYLVDDIDPTNYKYANKRVETTILVAAQFVTLQTDFNNTYTINVEQCTLSPDPTDSDTKDNAFINLTALKAACIMLGSEVRSESGNAISIKDGPSAIDLRGVASTLVTLYQDLCKKYDQMLLDYRAGSSVAGQAILGPYSPGSDLVSRGNLGHRDGYL
ncbi:MAG: hypothetical protein FI729_01850 [SAR202 cluster bacterium]|nr:hypothetical protein [SAR202 cluster bacterium]